VDEEEGGVMFWKRDSDLAFDAQIGFWLVFIECSAVPEFG